ncbi:hypothetical protein [Paracoccus sulfuroxidans]|uniref:hypothetical protein n=1 Tax=Paracoccus sulfuroxidans TaxID=384678 RepID=UPI000FDF7481|nr:hypothetical protein [Paracoccus sulfuroxidans]AZV00310.1 hypothetical protein psul1_p02 [Paracoccus phage vB_PsuS_Psul1]
MTERTVFKQSDVTRAQKATIAAGLHVARTEISPDGRIVIYHDTPAINDNLSPYEKWKAEQNARQA